MFKQMQVRKLVSDEAERTGKLLADMEMRARRLPQGSLCENKGYLYRVFYEAGKRRQVIIPKGFEGREELVDELRERRYLSEAIPVLRGNLECCDRFAKGFRPYDPWEIGRGLPSVYGGYDRGKLLLPGDVDPEAWAAERYEINDGFPEGKLYSSEGGVWTRSKAEADIATKLEQHGLVFRYEELIHVGGRVMSPDFSVLHPVERRVKYWEHLGMMDDPEYAARAVEKLCHYGEWGIRLGDELIVTWETRGRPLLFSQINGCIERYLK